MKVSTEKLEKSRMTLQVEVEPELLEHSMERAYRRLVNRTNIPGFRRGKAPRFMVERYLGRPMLLQEALDILVPEAYSQALKEQSVEPVGQPDIEIIQLEPELSFKATVAVKPTVELGDYHQLSFTKETPTVTDEQVEEVVKDLRDRLAQVESVERPAQLDDQVVVDVESTLAGEPYLNQNDVSYIMTEGRTEPMPGFPEELAGMQKGETKNFFLTFPEDHADESKAGKTASFKITMKDVKERHLAELNNEFAQQVDPKFETLEALRQDVRSELQTNAEREAKTKLELEVVDAAVAQATMEYPEIMVEHEIEHLIADDPQVLRDPEGKLDMFLEVLGITMEEFQERYREDASHRIERSLVVEKLAEQEQIEVSDADIDAEVDTAVGALGEQAETYRQWFNTPERRESIQRQLLGRKAVERLVEIATSGNGTAPQDESAAAKPARSRRKKEPDKAEATETQSS